MKKITLLIADDVYEELRSCQSVRLMVGSAYGTQDAFMMKLLESIDKGESEIEIKYKKKK